ncbi:hypothetical protein MIND_00063100 [Mycena indigotica]|uniref:Uncharacterized protein n=1 Tax=Mycena indigotica TaxID=2126181 RepID=A0A8H6WE91_9AGAR|nr:uncharacterized protein MIND_00063100 [Mycena indigotica]KAF7315479.1 hypothetical protein MIND_00063100 [Mycena indigotica]
MVESLACYTNSQMPLFKSQPAQPEPAPAPQKGGLFSRNRSPTPPPPATTNTHRGFFSRRRSSEDSSLDGRSSGSDRFLARGGSVRSGGSGSFFNRNNNHLDAVHRDPKIMAAKAKVGLAEKAEVEADRALSAARTMVREAKEHVRILEREAAEEHKRAKAKQAVANDVSRTAASLGRHGN